MKYKNIMRNLLLVIVAMTTLSCTANYLEINTNPYEVSKEQMATDGYDVGAAITALCGTVVSSDVNTAQLTDCLLGGPMGGYYSTTGAWNHPVIDNFYNKEDWTRVFMASDRIIPTLFTNLKELKNITDDPVVLAIAQVIKVTAMSRVTDTYGPIPYSKIGVDGQLAVPYDSQQDVYKQMFAELEEAVTVLTGNRNVFISENADPVYGGSAEKWCKFANSLRFRLAMRLSYADKVTAQAEILKSLTHEVGVFTSNDDNAALKAIAFGDKGNPIYVSVKYNQPKGCDTGGDTHAAADITSYMNAYDDPRRDLYFTPSEFPEPENRYIGMPIRIKKPSLEKVGRKFSGVKLTPTDPVMWMNAAEVAFLKAEAKAVFEFDLGPAEGNAEDFYNEGIRLSMEQWGVGGSYETYANNDNPVKVQYSCSEVDSPSETLTELAVKWDQDASKEVMQERILIQKWIANYHLGNEAWADHRRTGYPNFFAVVGDGNQSEGKCVDNDLGARRMPYPGLEKTNNGENYQKAVSMLGGADNMGTRVWWDCKPSGSSK